MREYHEHILQKLIVELVKDLEPEPLLLHLYQKGIIDQDDMDEIRSKKIRKDVNEDGTVENLMVEQYNIWWWKGGKEMLKK